MKKIFYKGLSLALVLLLYSCSEFDQEQRSEENTVAAETSYSEIQNRGILKISEDSPVYAEAMAAYEAFLHNELSVEMGGWDSPFTIAEIPWGTLVPYEEVVDSYVYALFDMNKDGLPELHIRMPGHYIILTYYNGELIRWYEGIYCEWPTSNGNILYIRNGGGPLNVVYQYISLDYWGKVIDRLYFAKYDSNQDGQFTMDDDYYFEDIILTQEDWLTLTEKYLNFEETSIIWLPITMDVCLTS